MACDDIPANMNERQAQHKERSRQGEYNHGRPWPNLPSGRSRSNMAPRLVALLLVVSPWALYLATAVTLEPTPLHPNELDRRVRLGSGSADFGQRRTLNAGDGADGRPEENIIVREGILFQTDGCPQAISEEEASTRIKDDSIPGNIINLASEGEGRAGNHFVVLSAYFAMAYCCKTKVLEMPKYDDTFPSAASEDGGRFEADKHFFDFSGVSAMPLEEYEGLSSDPAVCKPYFELSGLDAWHLWKIHADLLSCMNRVYVRGCEAAYLEPLLGAERFGYCANPAATNGRRLSDNDERRDTGATPPTPATTLVTADVGTGTPGSAPPRVAQSGPFNDGSDHDRLQDPRVGDITTVEDGSSEGSGSGMPSRFKVSGDHTDAMDGRRGLGATREDDSSAGGGPKLGMASPSVHSDREYSRSSMSDVSKRGSAGSLVIHIRSGDIFRPVKPGRVPSRCFLSYGQPPLQFYLRAIASQLWSDVTILTFSPTPDQINPTFAALEMMQGTGLLGPNVVTHKDRDLLTDIRSMLCADGLAVARSTLHFLTFAHTRAKHVFIPSECGPGTYARGRRDGRKSRKKPNPNNTTLLCIENPETEVYGVDWEVDEAAYFLYDNWDASPEQRQDMVLFDGVKGLKRCCAR